MSEFQTYCLIRGKHHDATIQYHVEPPWPEMGRLSDHIVITDIQTEGRSILPIVKASLSSASWDDLVAAVYTHHYYANPEPLFSL